jgi:hypothetical protein
MFLKTLYDIIHKLGKIANLPNMSDVIKTINELSVLHNNVYRILKTTPNKKQCINKLRKLWVDNPSNPVFSEERVLEIIENKLKIMEPFDTVFYHREKKTQRGSGLKRHSRRSVRGGEASTDTTVDVVDVASEKAAVIPDLTQQIAELEIELKKLDDETTDKQNKQRDLQELRLIQELQVIMTKNSDITIPKIKQDILAKLTEINKIREERKTLGCLKKEFSDGEGIWSYMPEFIRSSDIGGSYREYMDMLIDKKNYIVGTAKYIAKGLGIDDMCMLINPEIEAKDWVLYPMWSLEQTLYVGEGISIQLDFISLIISQLDALFKLGAMSMSGAKMGIIQSALTGMAASTGGVAIAAAPVIGPAMGVAYDIAVYLFGNMANIINMFIMISRKKHDGAFTLLTDIIPGMATTLNKAINFLSILTNLSGKAINVLDQFTGLLDSSFLKNEFKDITGPITILPVVGKMVKDKVALNLFVKTNMLADTFIIEDNKFEYEFMETEKEGVMVELDPNIKAAYIIDQELYPCVLLKNADNMLYVGKYYNERFVSFIKRENTKGSPWIEEYTNIFIGGNEIKPASKRHADDYKTLKDCGYRLFVKNNSIPESVFNALYITKDSNYVKEFIRKKDVSKDKYKLNEDALKERMGNKTTPQQKQTEQLYDVEPSAPPLEEDEDENPPPPEDEDDDLPPPPDDDLPPPPEDDDLPPPPDDDDLPPPPEEEEELNGGYRFISKKSRNNNQNRTSNKNKKKSVKHKKLNQYSRKYIRNKRRNVSLRNH